MIPVRQEQRADRAEERERLVATVAHEVVAMLRQAGVDRIFGIPGGGASSDLASACEELGMEFVLTQHESSAVIMAGVYGQMRGTVGVAVCALGPGVANLVNGAAHALLDRLPVVIFSDRYSERLVHVAVRQRIDHLALLRPVTKDQLTLHEATFRETVRRAVRTALAARPGPVFVDFPTNVASARAEACGTAREPAAPVTAPPQVAQPVLSAAASFLAGARRPVILAGIGATGLRAGLVGELADALRAPVLTSPKAKGVISAEDPWCAGVFMGGKLEAEVLERADAVVMVGYDPVELLPRPWTHPAPVVCLDELPPVEQLYQAGWELIGDVGDAAGRLARELRRQGGASQWSPEEVASHRRRMREALAVQVEGLSPNDVIAITRQVVPRDTILVTDVGISKLLVVVLWESYGPGEFLMSNGLATMGFSVPAAVAAALARPGRPVVCLSGDAGFVMRLPELITARRQGVRAVFVVFADDGHSLIAVKQRKKGLRPAGTGFPNPGYPQWASALGMLGVTATTPEQYRQALQQALDSPTGAIVEARINPAGYMEQFDVIRDL